jgi:hypothetical protein
MKLDLFNRKIVSWLEDGYLCRDRVIQWLQGIVDKVLKTVNWPRNIKVRTMSLHYSNALILLIFGAYAYWCIGRLFPKPKCPEHKAYCPNLCVSLRMYDAVTSLNFLYLHWFSSLTQDQHLLSDFLVIL